MISPDQKIIKHINKKNVNFTEELRDSLEFFLNKEGIEELDKLIIKSLLSTIEEYEEIEKQIDTLMELLSTKEILDDNAIVNVHGEINRLMIIRAELKDKITKNLLGLKRIINSKKSNDEDNNINKYMRTLKIVNPEEF